MFDVANGVNWITTSTVLTTNNSDRAIVNAVRSVQFGIVKGEPVVCWHRRLKREVPRALKSLIYNEDLCPELFAVFVKNAPGQILDNGNGNVFRGIANGTPCRLFALTWDNVED